MTWTTFVYQQAAILPYLDGVLTCECGSSAAQAAEATQEGLLQGSSVDSRSGKGEPMGARSRAGHLHPQ